jgi:hypothetical protein
VRRDSIRALLGSLLSAHLALNIREFPWAG